MIIAILCGIGRTRRENTRNDELSTPECFSAPRRSISSFERSVNIPIDVCAIYRFNLSLSIIFLKRCESFLLCENGRTLQIQRAEAGHSK